MPTIKIYKEHRLDEYLNIRKEVFVNEQQVDPNIEIDEYDRLDRDDVIHFAYWHEKELLSVARAILLENKTVKLGRFATLVQWRSKGYGSQLLKDIEIYFHNIGYHRIILHAQSNALSFYLRNGYKVEGTPFIEANIEHVLVFKSI